MKKKNLFKRFPWLLHLLIVFIITLVLLSTLNVWLGIYTRHGEMEIVPDLSRISVDVAAEVLENAHLQYEVVDSVYQNKLPPGVVVEQNPKAGTPVKENRRIYLTINAKTPQLIPLPSAVEVSLRQAQTLLEGSGFHVRGVVYKPSLYKDLVLEIHFRNRVVHPGEKLPAESALELWVGSGSLDDTDAAILDSLQNGMMDNPIGSESLEEDIRL